MSSKSSYRYSNAKYLFIIACLWAGFSFFSSCSPNSGVGVNVLPTGDMINAHFQDTSTVHATLLLKDSDFTTGTLYCLLGSYTDPIFGSEKASFYTQVLLANGSAVTFPAGTTIDSVVLRLPFSTTSSYGNHYGSLSPQTFEVYQLDSSVVTGKAYYSTDTLRRGVLLGKQTIVPDPNTFVNGTYPSWGTTTSYYPEIHIKLNAQWAQDSIVNAPATSLASSTAFLQKIHGLYITVSNSLQLPGQGGIMYIDQSLSGAGLFLYSHYTLDTLTHLQTGFGIGYGGTYFSHFDHNYSGTPFYMNSSKADSVSSPYLTYLQGMGGVKVLINFPYLKNWVKKNAIIVNRAEVELPLDVADNAGIEPPSALALLGIYTGAKGNDTGFYALPDSYYTTYGGSYNATSQIYDFDIADYIQKVLDGKIVDHGLYLTISGGSVSANRVVLYGPVAMSKSSPHLRLKMYYTPLKP